MSLKAIGPSVGVSQKRLPQCSIPTYVVPPPPDYDFFSGRNGVLFIQSIVVIEHLLSNRKVPRPIEWRARPGL